MEYKIIYAAVALRPDRKLGGKIISDLNGKPFLRNAIYNILHNLSKIEDMVFHTLSPR